MKNMHVLAIILLTGIILAYSASCSKKRVPAGPLTFTTPTVTCTITPTFTPTIPPGTIWNQTAAAPSFTGRSQLTTLSYNGKMFNLAGARYAAMYNDVWSSTDGITWNSETANGGFPGRYSHSSTVYTNVFAGLSPGIEKMWIIGGYNGSYLSDVWCSSDGISWSQATATAAFGNRAEQVTVVFNGSMWVIAGGITGNITTNDVYSSSDGATWTLATANAGFSNRKQHSGVVYNNRIWVIGGNTGTTLLNDVWYSSDGVIWNNATMNAAFNPRYGHVSLVYDNKMWVIGGGITGTVINDAWYSTDGITWTAAAITIPFTARTFHSGTVYGNKMWVIAGTGGGVYFNSVWSAQ